MRNAIKTLIVITLLSLLTPAAASGADKVVERSAKQTPAWLAEQPTGHIIVEIERPTLGEAQAAAEMELARRIISAVATNITHSSKSSASEEITDDSHKYLESFSSSTEMSAANLPFLKGVSLARAKGTYWEKREEKKSKRQYVVFSVLYPLSQSELDDMTIKFEMTDKEKSGELASLRQNLSTVDSSDAIQDAIGRLEALQEYFFDSVRLAEAKALAASYKECYKGLTLSGEFTSGKKELVCRVKLNGRPFKVTARLELKANCASQLGVTHSDDGYSFIITYSDADCLDTEENWIEVGLRLKNARLREKFFLP